MAARAARAAAKNSAACARWVSITGAAAIQAPSAAIDTLTQTTHPRHGLAARRRACKHRADHEHKTAGPPPPDGGDTWKPCWKQLRSSSPPRRSTPPPALFNFATHLFRLNEARAGKTAYIDDTGTTTYGELEERARRFASALRTLGVHPEERVLLVMLDTVALPIAFLGALYAGVVPVVANTLLTPPTMCTCSRTAMRAP